MLLKLMMAALFFVGEISLDGISTDIWVVKVDQNGDLVWQNIYNYYRLYNSGNSIEQTADGGFIVVGSAASYDEHGDLNRNLRIMKLDKDGTFLWQKIFDGGASERGHSVLETSNGDFVVAGYTASTGAGESDAWILRLNNIGNVVWQKTYGGASADIAYSIYATDDAGFVVAGSTESFGAGQIDAWVFKVNGSGDLLWQKTYGNEYDDGLYSIYQSVDGKYLVAGYTELASFGRSDAWAFKLDGNGNVADCAQVGDSAAIVQNSSVAPQDKLPRQETPSILTDKPTHSMVNGEYLQSQLCPALAP